MSSRRKMDPHPGCRLGGTLDCGESNWGVPGALWGELWVFGGANVYTAQLFWPGGESISCHIFQQKIILF